MHALPTSQHLVYAASLILVSSSLLFRTCSAQTSLLENATTTTILTDNTSTINPSRTTIITFAVIGSTAFLAAIITVCLLMRRSRLQPKLEWKDKPGCNSSLDRRASRATITTSKSTECLSLSALEPLDLLQVTKDDDCFVMEIERCFSNASKERDDRGLFGSFPALEPTDIHAIQNQRANMDRVFHLPVPHPRYSITVPNSRHFDTTLVGSRILTTHYASAQTSLQYHNRPTRSYTGFTREEALHLADCFRSSLIQGLASDVGSSDGADTITTVSDTSHGGGWLMPLPQLQIRRAS